MNSQGKSRVTKSWNYSAAAGWLPFTGARNNTGDIFAIKLLPHDFASNPVSLKRFESEIKILKSLDHPNLVTTHEAGVSASGLPYFVMEEMTGGDLGSLGNLSLETCLDYVSQVCEALEFLHLSGLLHRDLKPSNLLLNEDRSVVKIADFGLAKPLGAELSQMSLTRTGTQVGTMHFLAPELLTDPDLLSMRSDLYSLGVVLYYLLTGNLPVGHYEPVSTPPGHHPERRCIFQTRLKLEPAEEVFICRGISNGNVQSANSGQQL